MLVLVLALVLVFVLGLKSVGYLIRYLFCNVMNIFKCLSVDFILSCYMFKIYPTYGIG